MKLAAAALILLCTLAACAAPRPAPRYAWVKPGATYEQREADRGYCEAQAVSATRDIERIVLIIGGCMRGRGWTLIEL